MYRLTVGILIIVVALMFVQTSSGDDPNTLTAEEREAGFELLFDGTGFEGWKQSGNWKVEEGVIARAARGGSLVYQTKKIPDDFELCFQWKVGKGSNSGIYYRPGQYEYQILDDRVHADGRNPRTSAASLYFCMAPSRSAAKPVGRWNSGRIVCKGTIVQHWLNGEKVVHFDYADPKWKFNVEMLRQRGGDLAARGAYLSLQDHGDPVWYRGIKLRELRVDDELDSTLVTPQSISPETLKIEQDKLKKIIERRQSQAKKKG